MDEREEREDRRVLNEDATSSSTSRLDTGYLCQSFSLSQATPENGRMKAGRQLTSLRTCIHLSIRVIASRYFINFCLAKIWLKHLAHQRNKCSIQERSTNIPHLNVLGLYHLTILCLLSRRRKEITCQLPSNQRISRSLVNANLGTTLWNMRYDYKAIRAPDWLGGNPAKGRKGSVRHQIRDFFEKVQRGY